MFMLMAFQFRFFVVFLLCYSQQLTEGIKFQGSKTYNGGRCTADKQGAYRIAIQYCNGRDWLTMQPGKGNAVTDVLGKNCYDIKNKGLDRGDGEYMIDPDGRSDDNAFKVYCDMTSFGGGWTMCYTTDNHVDIKKEVSSKFVYGIDGYRANCNDIPFTEVMFVDENSKEKASFTKTGPEITFKNNYGKGASTYGQWNGHGVVSDSIKYQLMICDTSFYKGLHVSGYTKSCYKSCDSWCGDFSSAYFRTTSVIGKPRFVGVAFNVNGHRHLHKHLISAGIR